jgi:hypothetical protein
MIKFQNCLDELNGDIAETFSPSKLPLTHYRDFRRQSPPDEFDS